MTTSLPPGSTSNESSTETVQLAPSFSVALGCVAIAFLVMIIQPIAGAVLALFGVFLLFQTVSLRLCFTATALEVFRGDTRIRRFPYQEWQNWEIFWPPVPVLFYFKEVQSIHFLPILFDPKALKACLEQRVPKP